MKKVVLILLLLAGYGSLAFSQLSGTCGENLVFSYLNGTLVIGPAKGTSGGPMEDYGLGPSPWPGVGEVYIQDGVTSIGSSAFNDCYMLRSVEISNSVTSIGDYAFYGCSKLSSVTIPESVLSIGNYTFSECSMPSIEIPASVTSIGEYAFSECRRLVSVTIPNSVTSIGKGAFLRCSILRSATIPNGTIGDGAFCYCTDLISVTIGGGVTAIGSYAFRECKGLTSVTIPNSVTTIGDYAFYECSGLRSVMIGEGVTTIGERAFHECTGLTSVTIPNSVTEIGPSAFRGCSGLTSVTIGESLTTIEDRAFEYCTGLSSVTIPESVSSIGNYTFAGCTNLREIINYQCNPIELPFASFVGVDVSKVRLVVPEGCGAAYQQAEIWRDFQIVEMPFVPEFSEEEGVLPCGTRVSIDCASSDAVIYYGIGKNAEPTLLHEGSIAVTDTTYICAVAQRGDERSKVVRVTYFADHTSFLNAHEAVAPTCEEGRKAYWECGRCEKLFSDAEATTEISEFEIIDVLGHDLTAHEAVAATCTEEGRKAYWECGRCQTLFSDAEATTEISELEIIDVLGHDLTAHEAVAATCTEEGRKAYWECGRCQTLFSDAEATTEIAEPEKMAAIGHAYNQPIWTWTEDYQASVTFTCFHCSHEERPNVTVRSEITRPATPTREGERTYTATTVFEGETYTDTKTEVIPIEPTASEATVLVEGVKIYPNPSRGEFKMELPIDAQVEIFDVSGKKVLAQTRPAGTHGFSLTQTGIYVLKVFACGQQATFRLVVR